MVIAIARLEGVRLSGISKSEAAHNVAITQLVNIVSFALMDSMGILGTEGDVKV